MINQLILVGKIKKMEIVENDYSIFLEVKRNFKNNQGVFETDIFKCYLWIALYKKMMITCKEGDIVFLRGRLYEKDNFCNILAEQVLLLNKGV